MNDTRVAHLVSVSVATMALATMVGCAAQRSTSRCADPAALVPAYVSPAELSRIADQIDPSSLLVINPHNGSGAAKDPAFAEAIDRLRSAGIPMLGYVATDYGTRDPRVVVQDAARYARWYGIDGIFLDEVTTAEAALPRYTRLVSQLRARDVRPIALNPGHTPAPGYFALADIIVTFEGTYADYRNLTTPAPSPSAGVMRARTAHLIFDATPAQAEQVRHTSRADYVYATPGTMPNPWQVASPTLTARPAGQRPC